MISLNWVGDYIDIKDQDVNELALKITKAGINIEGVYTHHIDNLVIGEIKKVEEHPDSDHLHVCQVNIGNENLQIVCGAHNVKKGLKVIVAKVGAILPGDFEIKKSKIRGVESCGMMCALFELGLEEKVLLNNIMSMKYSFDNVYATSEKIMQMTGLSSEQYDSALRGLEEKELVTKRGNEWRILPDNINSITGVEMYDMDQLRNKK